MAGAHPFFSLLLIAFGSAAILGVARFFGLAVGPFGITKRDDNPEAFDLGLLLAGGMIAMVLLISAFGVLAGQNSERLTKSYLDELRRGETTAKAL